MKAVNVAQLKNNLSLYLRKVKAGEEIIVKDRNAPVAKIIPWEMNQEDELADMAAKGLVRLGKGEMDDEFWNNFWNIPVPKVSEEAVRRVVEAEREEGW